MKNYLVLIAIGLLLMLNACSDDAKVKNSQDVAGVPENGLTIEEAKAYFEKNMFKDSESRTMTEAETMPCLSTGAFTPLWKQAKESYDMKVSNLDIPILPEFRHKAFRTYKSKAYVTRIEQKLVISKSLKTNKISSYILTLIPDMGNTKSYINQFTTKADKGKFSGWVIYSLSQANIPVLAEYYKDGNKEKNIIIPKIEGKKNVNSIAFNNFIKKEIQLAAFHSVQSRSFGEDDDYDNFGDWFMNEIWPDAEDGDSFEMKHDDDGWYLEDDKGTRYDVPDDFSDDFEWEEDFPLEDVTFGDDNIDIGLGFKIYHGACGTYLGFMLLEDWENTVMYCPTCKKYVLVRY